MTTLLFLIGLTIAFVSGLVGLGGSVLLIPALMFLPPLFGFEPLDMKTISGIVVVSILATAIVAFIRNRQNGYVSNKLLIVMGSSLAVSSVIGAYISQYLSNGTMEVIFAILALIAAILMSMPPKNTQDREIDIKSLDFNIYLAIVSAVMIGLLNGILGAAGAFIIIPVIVTLLKLPLRVAIGTTFGLVVIAALFGGMGKVLVGQVDWLLAAPSVIGAIIGSYFGAMLSKKVKLDYLRWGLIIMIGFVALSIIYKVLKEFVYA